MTDSVLRAIADDGSFRVIAAITTETARGAAEAQRVKGASAGYLGELLTGAILLRETMAPQLRLQAILKGTSASGTLVADSYPDGTARGLVSGAARTAPLTVNEGALLQVMRTLQNGAVQQGIVEFNRDSVSSAFMQYLQDSEQVTSVVAVTALLDHDDVHVAGGYLVQLLPEVSPEALAAMTDRLARLPSIESLISLGKTTPLGLINALLSGVAYTQLEERPLSFSCRCSKERLLSSLATIDKGEIRSMIDEGKDIEITCDFCNHDYRIPVSDLASLLR